MLYIYDDIRVVCFLLYAASNAPKLAKDNWKDGKISVWNVFPKKSYLIFTWIFFLPGIDERAHHGLVNNEQLTRQIDKQTTITLVSTSYELCKKKRLEYVF